MNVGVLYSRIRRDEKLLLSELRDRGHEVTKIDVRKERFGVHEPPGIFEGLDIVVDRCLATSRSRYITRFVDAYGVPVVNEPETAAICADKARHSLVLAGADVPTPATEVTFTKEAAMESIEEFGYPCVLKPVIGSWGRLMAKIDSRDAAEAILSASSIRSSRICFVPFLSVTSTLWMRSRTSRRASECSSVTKSSSLCLSSQNRR